MASLPPPKADASVFTNLVTAPLSTDKLDGSNYDSWASDIKLWLKGQGYVDHLTTREDSVAEAERQKWSKIDAQLYDIIKSTIHPSVKQIFRSHDTCESVWSQAQSLYTNDIQHLYRVCQDLMDAVTDQRLDGTMSTYLGRMIGFLHDYNELIPPAATPAKELEQRQTFFMLLTLYGLPAEYSPIRDQILGSTIVPTMTSA